MQFSSNFPKMTGEKKDRASLIAKERGTPDFKDRSPKPVELELEQKGMYEGSGGEKGKVQLTSQQPHI